MVFAAHPDDEVLGCGGTIAKYAQAGAEIHVRIMAEGIASRDPQRESNARSAELSALGEAAKEANRLLGVSSLVLDAYPDNRMDSVDLLDVVKTVEAHIREHQPNIVFTHHAGDINIDHRRLHEAVVTACRPMPGACVDTLLFFEVPSSTEWQAAGQYQHSFPPGTRTLPRPGSSNARPSRSIAPKCAHGLMPGR